MQASVSARGDPDEGLERRYERRGARRIDVLLEADPPARRPSITSSLARNIRRIHEQEGETRHLVGRDCNPADIRE